MIPVMKDLDLIQKEIATALEQLKEKSLITEAVLAKKVRENAKIQGKNKAGICLKDLETCVEFLAENKQLYFSLHVNSANDILIKKEDFPKPMDSDSKKAPPVQRKINFSFDQRRPARKKLRRKIPSKTHRS